MGEEVDKFFTFEPVGEKKKTPIGKRKYVKKKPSTCVQVEKIIVHRSKDKDGNVCICWADKSTIHPEALKYYDKYKDFY